MFLIDTVTLSELRKRKRDPMVVKWFERQRTTDLFLSVISIGEIERGIARQRTIDPRLCRRSRGLAGPRPDSLRREGRAIRPANRAALGLPERRTRP